jgi:hypothetical protein
MLWKDSDMDGSEAALRKDKPVPANPPSSGVSDAAGPETVEILRNIKTEIGAGMVLFPKSEAERAHNNACARANAIITNYQEGYGLFQMTRRAKARGEKPNAE